MPEREREREIDYGFDKEFWHPENGRNFDLFSLMSLRERERERWTQSIIRPKCVIWWVKHLVSILNE